MVGYQPPSVYLSLSDITARDQITQAFPLCICIHTASDQRLEVGMGWNEAKMVGLGMRLPTPSAIII